MVTSSCRPDLPWSRSLEPYRASWRSGSNPCCPDLNPSSPRSELNDLLPLFGRTELAVILGASASWQGGEGPGRQDNSVNCTTGNKKINRQIHENGEETGRVNPFYGETRETRYDFLYTIGKPMSSATSSRFPRSNRTNFTTRKNVSSV